MTTQQATEDRKGAIKEVQRVSGLIPGTMTLRQYNEEARPPYRSESIRMRLKLTFNELKAAAGLTVNNKKRRGRLKSKDQSDTTERRCNMSHCGRLFRAVGHMRSCPACTRLKNNNPLYC